jgi:choline dehydrogenase-like flavoprotein
MTAADVFVKRRRLVVSTEQCPNPDSRVTLSNERDALGMPKVRLDWRLNDLDRYTMRRTGEILRDDLCRAGIVETARDVLDDAEAPRWNWHHIGTTRMHEDPRRGVVDADCRVHGLDNLYVAGSSVFPTAGNHTPTLTIIALACRTADHLHAVLRRPDAVTTTHQGTRSEREGADMGACAAQTQTPEVFYPGPSPASA